MDDTQSSFATWEFAQGFHGKEGFLVTSMFPGSVRVFLFFSFSLGKIVVFSNQTSLPKQTEYCSTQVILAAKESAKVLNDTYFSMSYNAHRIQGERPFKEAVPMYIDTPHSALFVALKPDDTDASPALLAKAVLEEAAEGTWAKLQHLCRNHSG